MAERLSVIAAIPNYNMATSLGNLLAQVSAQDYDAIYVIDDASTDNSVAVARSFPQVNVIEGETNVGPGANRNRIMPAIGQEAILHFIDADVTLQSSNNAELARAAFANDARLGLAGGLISLPDGTPWIFNYGPRYSLYSQISGWFQAKLYTLEKADAKTAPLFRSLTKWWRKEYPNVLEEPAQKPVYWVGEANMVIPSKIFAEVGGFDPQLRYHEAQDLAIKLHNRGYKVLFWPDISVTHPFIDLNAVQRRALESKAGLQLMHKYGVHLR